jgi:hypothetical protein
MRKLDLQYALTRASTTTEDFQDKTGSVEHFRAPGPFEIALLHG